MLLRDFVNKKMASADKEASAEGYPLELSNCKKYKPMRDLKIYGNSFQDGTPSPETPIEVQSVGELVTDESDSNYGKYKIPVVVKGINLFDKTKVSEGYINDADGEYRPVADGTSYASDYIEIPPNQKFYITFTPTHQWAAAYDENKQFVKGMYGYGSAKTMPSNAKYIRITIKSEYIDTMQVQLGTTATPYEPYVEPIITNIFLDEPLRKLGDYADSVDFKNKKVVRNTCEHIITSSGVRNKSGWHLERGWNTYEYVNLPYPAYKYPWSVTDLCSHFQKPASYTTDAIKQYSFSISAANNNILYLFTTEATGETVAEFKALLDEIGADKPIKFYYRLAEPIEEPLNINLPKLTAKTTIIEVDTSLAPSNAYGKYIKK